MSLDKLIEIDKNIEIFQQDIENCQWGIENYQQFIEIYQQGIENCQRCIEIFQDEKQKLLLNKKLEAKYIMHKLMEGEL